MPPAHGVSTGKTEKCDECDFETVSKGSNSRYNMLRHKRNKHGSQKLSCDDCDYETPRRDTLLKHRRIKHGERENSKLDTKSELDETKETEAKAVVEVPIITKKELSEDEADAVLDALSSHFMSDKVHID